MGSETGAELSSDKYPKSQLYTFQSGQKRRIKT